MVSKKFSNSKEHPNDTELSPKTCPHVISKVHPYQTEVPIDHVQNQHDDDLKPGGKATVQPARDNLHGKTSSIMRKGVSSSPV